MVSVIQNLQSILILGTHQTTGLLKNRISELEKQLADKNAIIEFLSAQIISKPPDKTRKDSSDNYRHHSNDNDRLVTNGNNQDNASNEKSSNDGRSKEVIVVGDSMLNNLNSCRLSKSKKFEVINFPGSTSTDIVENIDKIPENQQPKSLIVHLGTNDFTKNVNLLNSVKKIVNKTKKESPDTVLRFSNIIVQKDKKNLEKLRTDTNARLKNYCAQKKLSLIDHDNIKESHPGIKKSHLNRKGNSLFAKNLLSFIESNCILDYDGDSFSEEHCVSNDPTVLQSDVEKALKDIRISNMNKLIFGHMNINSLRNKFDLSSEQVKVP